MKTMFALIRIYPSVQYLRNQRSLILEIAEKIKNNEDGYTEDDFQHCCCKTAITTSYTADRKNAQLFPTKELAESFLADHPCPSVHVVQVKVKE